LKEEIANRISSSEIIPSSKLESSITSTFDGLNGLGLPVVLGSAGK
jgi:hypothetical protein